MRLKFFPLVVLVVGIGCSSVWADFCAGNDPVRSCGWAQDHIWVGSHGDEAHANILSTLGGGSWDRADFGLFDDTIPGDLLRLSPLAGAGGNAIDRLSLELWPESDTDGVSPFASYLSGETCRYGSHALNWGCDDGEREEDWTVVLPDNWDERHVRHAPVPGGVLLGVIGLGLIGQLRRRH